MSTIQTGKEEFNNLNAKFTQVSAQLAELVAAVKARRDLSEEIRTKGAGPHADYWNQSIVEAEVRITKAMMVGSAPNTTLKAENIPIPTIEVDNAECPDITMVNCDFVGLNLDGSPALEFGEGKDGIATLKSINMTGWVCYGPLRHPQEV